MILELALDSALTLGAYKGTEVLFDIAKINWQKSGNFRRLFWTQKRWHKEYNAYRNRVWELEKETGVGLSLDTKEWLKKRFDLQEVKVTQKMYKDLAINQYNGAVDVYCLACSKKYAPHTSHYHGGAGVGYNYPGTTQTQKRMMQKLCKECYYDQKSWEAIK